MFDDAGDVQHILPVPVLEHVGHGVLHLELIGGGLVLAAPQLDRDSMPIAPLQNDECKCKALDSFQLFLSESVIVAALTCLLSELKLHC